MRFSKLQRLEDKYPLEPEKAKEELVGMWLDDDLNPTWEKLADAFEYAEQRALAKKIRETYNCEFLHYLFKSVVLSVVDKGLW